MKWVSHKIATGALVYAFTGNVIVAGISVLGSTFPDWIEGRPPDMKDTQAYNKWRRNHRQGSHWLIPYLCIFIACFSYAAGKNIFLINYHTLVYVLTAPNIANIIAFTLLFVAYFSLGSVLHILQDAICGKVPLILPHRKIGIKLFKVGSMLEYILVFPLSVFLIIWRFAAQYQLLEYLKAPDLPKLFW